MTSAHAAEGTSKVLHKDRGSCLAEKYKRLPFYRHDPRRVIIIVNLERIRKQVTQMLPFRRRML